MPELSAEQRRVLGVLMEKGMTQPDSYPMTLNAIVAACNQKQNRNPLMNIDGDTVLQTLDQLRERRLVTMEFPAPGARSKRYKHEVEKTLCWSRPQRAVMAELLVRGPQTVGELRTNAGRMNRFADLEAVSAVLDDLRQNDPPWVQAMPREPGRTTVRYQHLVYPQDEQPAETSKSEAAVPPGATSSGLRAEFDLLREEVQDLQRRMAWLEEQLR